MSREVRRVPLGWKHPVEPNPYWESQYAMRRHRGGPESRLHHVDERFVGLMSDYPDALAHWEGEMRSIESRTGSDWEWEVEYHLTGHQGRDDAEPVVHPYYTWSEDGETEIPVTVRDEDHLHELALARVHGERPDPADYMPVSDVPDEALGWCLYETVSEGTPVTPVFATAEELIEYLATVGQDWDQVPMRREAAERLVRASGSLGSMVAVGGRLYRSDTDADLLAKALEHEAGHAAEAFLLWVGCLLAALWFIVVMVVGR